MENKLTRWFVYEWGKPTWQKFYRVILRSPFSKIHYYHNKRLQVKESQYLIPYPNTQLNLFCSNNLSFSMHGTQYMTNQSMHRFKYVTNHQLEKDVGCKFLQFINMMKITKLLGYKTLQYTNIAASWRGRWTRVYVSSHSMLVKNFCIKLHQLWRPLK